jgi:hypothetical protein
LQDSECTGLPPYLLIPVEVVPGKFNTRSKNPEFFYNYFVFMMTLLKFCIGEKNELPKIRKFWIESCPDLPGHHAIWLDSR